MYIVEILKSIFFGIIEGITEWLPVSSTGHMILAEEFVKMQVSEAFWNVYLVVIQLGAILAVCLLFFRKLNPFSPSKSRVERQETFSMWGKVIVAVLPAAVLGLLLDDWMEQHLLNSIVVSITLILYGVLFVLLERRNRSASPKIRRIHQLSYQTALLIGLFQLLSLVPGTSRSGSTILGAMILGCSRYVAAEFSFFLAIPVMFGASGLKLVKALVVDGVSFTGQEWGLLAVGMATAFFVSLFAIKGLMGYIRKHDFTVFGWYRIGLGIVVILYFLLKTFVLKTA